MGTKVEQPENTAAAAADDEFDKAFAELAGGADGSVDEAAAVAAKADAGEQVLDNVSATAAEAGADEKSGEDSAAAAATPGAGDESDAAANADKGKAQAPTGGPAAGQAGQSQDAGGAPSIEDLTAQLAAITKDRDTLRHQYNSDRGRIAALQRQLQEQQAKPTPTAPAAPALTERDQQLIAGIQEDFPELAPHLEAYFKKERADINAEVEARINARLTPLEQAETTRAGREQAAHGAAEADLVEQAHAGWRALTNTDDFKQWMVEQPPGVRALAASDYSGDAISMLTMYKNARPDLFRKPAAPETNLAAAAGASEADELQRRRQENLEKSTGVGGARVSKSPQALDDFELAFKHFANQ